MTQTFPQMYFFVTAATAFFALLVVVFVTVFAVKHLKLGWTIIPFLVAMVIFAWATIVFFHMARAPD